MDWEPMLRTALANMGSSRGKLGVKLGRIVANMMAARRLANLGSVGGQSRMCLGPTWPDLRVVVHRTWANLWSIRGGGGDPNVAVGGRPDKPKSVKIPGYRHVIRQISDAPCRRGRALLSTDEALRMHIKKLSWLAICAKCDNSGALATCATQVGKSKNLVHRAGNRRKIPTCGPLSGGVALGRDKAQGPIQARPGGGGSELGVNLGRVVAPHGAERRILANLGPSGVNLKSSWGQPGSI